MNVSVIVITALGLAATCFAAEEPAALRRARSAYEKEVETAVRPIRERYIRLLADMKEALTKQGDIDAALLVEWEIILVEGLSKFAGDWEITYENGAIRHYAISRKGDVEWTDHRPAKKGKLIRDRGHYVLDFGDGKIERLTPTSSTFEVEHFDPSGRLAQGDPGLKGKAKRSQ